MHNGFYEEGDECPECKKGVLDWQEVDGCSCHTHPPCSACTSVVLECKKCGWEDDPPEYKAAPEEPGIASREYRPKPLDDTKVDYRVKSHTHFSMIKEGVYPKGMDRSEVEKEVSGTFGGRFERFGGGRFTYIAYTD